MPAASRSACGSAVANLRAVTAGIARGASVGLLSTACALLATLAPAAAAAPSERPEPPTKAAFRDSTRELLADPAFRRSPEAILRRGSGSAPAQGEGAIFPERRAVTLYGAPQLTATALGKRTPRGAARKILEQAEPYRRFGDREVVPGFDLIGVVATASPGADRKYRSRQPDEVIAEYLAEAREFGGRLVLDLQPGRSSVLNEVDALRPWLKQPDVDLAIDPEWNVSRRGVPGRTQGTIDASELNRVSKELNRIVRRQGLPPKLMVVHQFRRGSIRHRRRIVQRTGVTATLNFDGIGSPAAKEAGYVELARRRLYNGFSVFYDLDSRVMKPRSVLELMPEVDFLLYQ